MFAHSGTPVDPAPFAIMPIVNELIYYDGPLASIVQIGYPSDGHLVYDDDHLALEYFMDSEEAPTPEHPHQCRFRYLVVPIAREAVADLLAGRIDIRTALVQPLGWLIDIHTDEHRAWAVDVASEPRVMECIPDAGVCVPGANEGDGPGDPPT